MSSTRIILRGAVAAGSLAIVFLAAADEQQDAQQALVPRVSAGGPTSAGDPASPFSMISLNAVHREVDVVISTTLGSFAFTRSYTTTPLSWRIHLPEDVPNKRSYHFTGSFAARPFGASPTSSPRDTSIQWWHNLYSFVEVHPRMSICVTWPDGELECGLGAEDAEQKAVWIRDVDGGVSQFEFRHAPTISAFLKPLSVASPGLRLFEEISAGARVGYILYRPGDGRYYYGKKNRVAFTEPTYATGIDTNKVLYLNAIEDERYPERYPEPGELRRRRVEIDYATLDTTVGCVGSTKLAPRPMQARIGVSGDESTLATYKYEGKLSFTYQGNSEETCVLSGLYVESRPTSGPTEANLAAQYAYASGSSGRLASTTHPQASQPSRVVRYRYSQFEDEWEVRLGDGVTYDRPLTSKRLTVQGVKQITSEVTNGVIRSLNLTSPATTTGAANSITMDVSVDFSPPSRTPTMITDFFGGSIIKEIRNHCDTTLPDCPQINASGVQKWEVGTLIPPEGPKGTSVDVNKSYTDPRNHFTKWVTRLAPITSVPAAFAKGQYPVEIRNIYSGAADNAGAGHLRTESFDYEYGGAGSPDGVGRTYEQLLQSQWQDSLLSKAAAAKTSFAYHRSSDGLIDSNRLTHVIRSGYTRNVAGEVQARRVATVFSTSRTCGGQSGADRLGRIVEIRGPCFSTDGNSCANPAGQYEPVLQRHFYDPGDTNRANRLKWEKRYTKGCTPGAPFLERTFEDYDSRGHVIDERDENGVRTTTQYDGNLLMERTVHSSNGKVTTAYSYDNEQRLVESRLPDGTRERYCYRASQTGPACTGAPTSTLTWRGTYDAANSRFLSRFVYTYELGGLVRQELRDANDAVVTKVEFAADVLGRPAKERVGGLSDYQKVFLVDAAGNTTGVGLPFNGAPVECGAASGTTPTSAKCARFEFDRMNRVSEVVQYRSDVIAMASKTCVTYDRHGNIGSVVPGLAVDANCATQQADLGRIVYEHDDFGNVVSITTPWTTSPTAAGAPGVFRFEYDAIGNVVLRKRANSLPNEGPYMERDNYYYDGLSRLLSYVGVQDDGEPVEAYAFDYDETISPPRIPSNCPSSVDPVPPRTKGRLQRKRDARGFEWYSYNELGQVTKIQRTRHDRQDEACSAATSDATPNSSAIYKADGRLESQSYPHGRQIVYQYGGAHAGESQITTLQVTKVGGGKWFGIEDVRWHPDGSIRSYLIKPTTGPTARVEYLFGATANAAACNAREAADGTGRLRAVWVSMNAGEASGSGDIYKRSYRWKADQLVQQATCVKGAYARTEDYSYDYLQRLTGATRPVRDYKDHGGAFGAHSFESDTKGRVKHERRQAFWEVPFSYPTGNLNAHQVMSVGSPGSPFEIEYAYDGEGRTLRRTWPTTSIGRYTQDFWHYALEAPTSVARWFNAGGSVFGYAYDSDGRRIRKDYPLAGVVDEYFFSGTQLLEDRGNASEISPAGPYPLDEYIWLGGRPVALMKSQLTGPTKTREADETGDCTRNGESFACGAYFIVTDHIGKPVLMLDKSMRITGVADYQPYGMPNRATYYGDSKQPYPNTAGMDLNNLVLGYLNQVPETNMVVDVRARYAVVDTPVSGTQGKAVLTDHRGGPLATPGGGPAGAPVYGTTAGPRISDWVRVPGVNQTDPTQVGRVHVRFAASTAAPSSYKGIALSGYDYRRYESGAAPVWTGLGQPGQYYDAESDTFENWNRYYDPNIGRYLTPDPMLLESTYVENNVAMAVSVLSPYSYAGFNPIGSADPTGLELEEFIDVIGYKPVFDADDIIYDPPTMPIGSRGSRRGSGPRPGRVPSFGLPNNPRMAPLSPEAARAAAAIRNALNPVRPTSVNQLDEQVRRQQAPPDVVAVNGAKVPGEKNHIHFRGRIALNQDGTWKHGFRALTKREQVWIVTNGWNLPK